MTLFIVEKPAIALKLTLLFVVFITLEIVAFSLLKLRSMQTEIQVINKIQPSGVVLTKHSTRLNQYHNAPDEIEEDFINGKSEIIDSYFKSSEGTIAQTH